MENDDDDEQPMSDVLQELKLGSMLIKRKVNGKSFPRRFFLDKSEKFISYDESRKPLGRPRLYHIKDIDEVRPGFRAQTFGLLVHNGIIETTDEILGLSIMYNNHRNELHLMAPDGHTRDQWANGLQYLLDRHARTRQHHLILEETWILDYFRAADKDGSNSLTKRECRRLLTHAFHVKVADEAFEALFQEADENGEGTLNQEEFLGFFNLLTRRQELHDIMQENTENGYGQSMDEIHMTVDELLLFLQMVQHQIITVYSSTDDSTEELTFECIEVQEQVEKLIEEFETNAELKDSGLLGLDGFRNMLLSDDFGILNPIYSRQVYQDMTRPLSDYYISTSHNTYLFYSQLSGTSNPEAYNRVLLAGCRAVELDCYDGSDGQPVVKHAHTLVKPCSFESIIRYMEPNLFKASPYPVILNIENHCSMEQQKELARILKDILRDHLVTGADADTTLTVLPSPEDLKYKVLIRSRKSAKTTKANTLIQLEDDDDSIFDPLSKNIQSDLAELFVYLQNVPYRDYDYAIENYSSFHSSSLAEKRFEKIAREDPLSLVLQTSWRLIRIYPGGLRQDSSNANPVHAWNYGIQMAALNHQNEDDMMSLSYGKFLDNGGCGYILKPKYVLHANQTNFNPLEPKAHLDHPQILTITIISAQFLARSSSKTSDIPDPYVSVSVHGLDCDEQQQKTRVVNDNGFNPVWNEQLTFRIRFPQMSLIYFAIYDSDAFSRDDKLAYFCLPLTLMQTGYRHIHLRAPNHDPIHSTLFVLIDLRTDSEEITHTAL